MALTQGWTLEKYYTSESDSSDVIQKDETYDNAYIVITSFDGTKTKVSFMITVYENAAKENIITRQVYEFSHNAVDDAANIIKQAYLYLKSLPEFANAVDC